MSYGPNPWQQAHWDWRAAGNFICGGAGSGLLAFSMLSGMGGPTAVMLLWVGLGLVALGLVCVWLEIGRPLRASNVFFNLRGSWMSREALAAVFVFGFGLGLAAGVSAWAVPLALCALSFLYCQGRILQAARGIPAWREPLTVPLLVVSGLAEGAGCFWLVAAWLQAPQVPSIALFVLLVLGRWMVWLAWRRRIAATAAARALAEIDRAGRGLQWIGTALPVALAGLAGSGVVSGAVAALLLTGAGLAVFVSGARFKFNLITRAAFNQGFTLPRLPVRGVPR
jgi:phenylacetyl-CoA:acceptor oxidoreductase 26-kDa subunit